MRSYLLLAMVGLQVAVELVGGRALAVEYLQKSDSLIQYFDKATSTNNVAIGAFTYDAATNSFWTSGFTNANQQIRNIAWNGTAWVPTGTGAGAANNGYVSETTWNLYKRADGTQTTSTPAENTGWQLSQPTPGGMKLNPTAITIAGESYAAGTLMLFTDGGNIVRQQPGAVNRPELTKQLYWYNLTETGTSTASGPGVAPGPSTDYNGNNIVNWNDQFNTIITRTDLLNADVDSSGATTSNLSRSGAFSSNGQSFYMLDSASTLGGIYKVDLTTTGAVTKVLDADIGTPAAVANVINTEMAVLPTSVRNFGFAGTGDQIIVEGSAGLGNNGGLNAYLDDGATFNTTPETVFTGAEFDAFADTPSPGNNRYQSVVADAQGNLYFSNVTTDGVYKYDTEGRFIKLSAYQERREFQKKFATDSVGATANDFQLRTNTDAHGFAVTELLYSDTAFDAPIGILEYKPGDFDRDNDVDATDKAMFLAALQGRNVAATNLADAKFNLNGNVSTSVSSPVISQVGTTGTENVFHGIVDWKDVKILQTFLDFPDGDTNLDGVLNITDLNTMRDNYYTLVGATNKNWGHGDFASLDPESDIYGQWVQTNPIGSPTPTYAFQLPSDNGLVDLVDLELLAATWHDHPEFTQLTWADLDLNDYTGQFRLDVIEAFNLQELVATPGVPEPSSGLLLLLGAGFLARRRRSNRKALAA